MLQLQPMSDLFASGVEHIRAHVLIAGRVQGVYYRASTRDQAIALGLCGWVRNLRDGRVEAVFEGPKDAVDQMIRWCHQGPPAAVSKRLRWTTEPYKVYRGLRLHGNSPRWLITVVESCDLAPAGPGHRDDRSHSAALARVAAASAAFWGG